MQNLKSKRINTKDAMFAIQAIRWREFSNPEIIKQYQAKVRPKIQKLQIDDLGKIVYNLSFVQIEAN